jgi:CheY-like chemotaxis protein
VSKKKILIVEDEESLLRLESILLTSKGYDVTGVSSGLEALQVIPQLQPDLVLLDIMLPGLDGEEVGADWYITKPFKSAMVIETIQRFLTP